MPSNEPCTLIGGYRFLTASKRRGHDVFTLVRAFVKSAVKCSLAQRRVSKASSTLLSASIQDASTLHEKAIIELFAQIRRAMLKPPAHRNASGKLADGFEF
jgi:hypothetical protein